ncbi:MAG: protein kinase [Thermoanaerobaculia bacterium]
MTMTIAPGTRLGPYEITTKLGEGGMGEVYRATDSNLRREVAIKVLPAAFTEDKERLARFEREAQLLAQLNHPNIAQIYGLEKSGETRALVMELVEGPTLDERLASGSFSITESLSIALQLALALEEAHEKGIVHRDLKPQNIKASGEGKVKVLDFGLAKAMDPTAGSVASAADFARSPTIMNSPTLTAAHGTQLGVILGTAAYMAPEQARGAAVDKRADIWAFGVVLFEMISGRRLFEGELVTDVLANVLKSEVDFGALPPDAPPALRTLLRRCLARNPKNRMRDIGDARLVLEELAAGKTEEPAPIAPASALAPPRSFRAQLLPWALAAFAALAATFFAVAHLRAPRVEPARLIRFQLAPPESSTPTRRGNSFELSPDGRYLALTADGELWVRALDSVASQRIAGIQDATYPFWSPDAAWIGFFADGQLKRVPRDGGQAQKICDAVDGRGATWGPDGSIVYSDAQRSRGLWRVGAQGGTPKSVTQTPAGLLNHVHRYPQFLPDGRSFLFLYLAASPEVAGTYVGNLDGSAPVRVLASADQARFAPVGPDSASGYLLFRRESTLLAQAFDSARRQTSGEPTVVAEGVGTAVNTGSGAFALSANGILAWSSAESSRGELVWFDRSGKRLAAVNSEMRELQGLALAHGDRRLAYGTGEPSDIWLQSLPAGEPSRFTFGPDPGWAYPVWSPDGNDLAYTTWDLAGLPKYEIRRRRADRAGAEETLIQSHEALYPWDWTPGGQALLYGEGERELWLLPLTGERKPRLFLPANGKQVYAQFSPDGRLLAYAGIVEGRSEVLVTTVPPSGALWQISTAGGAMPRWRRDGRELYFRTTGGTLMAVALGTGSGADAIDERGAPQALFAGIPSSGNTPIFTYSPADDGQRFLVAASRDAASSPITVAVNWQTALANPNAKPDAP